MLREETGCLSLSIIFIIFLSEIRDSCSRLNTLSIDANQRAINFIFY